MTDPFYRAFEDKYRGSRELIKSRLETYLPYLEPFKQKEGYQNALDLGCGRGEWIELLSEHGFSTKGVDLDKDMLSSCKEKGFDVECGDALTVLKETKSDTQCVVSAFHMIEHITFDMVREIVQESIRVLKPGGLLILETPNAENLTVGTNNFYMDPTHKHPIPALLLEFVVDYTGFARSKIIRLNGPESGHFQAGSLLGVLEEVSPDYSVVAQKEAGETLLAEFNAVFQKEEGVSLHCRIREYDQAITENLGKHSFAIKEIVAAKDKLLESELRVKSLESELDQKSVSEQQLAHDLERARYDIHQLKTSTSWRITAPLRMVLHATKVILKGILKRLITAAMARPAMRQALNKFLKRYPKVWGHLRAFARHRGIVEQESQPASSQSVLYGHNDVLTARENRVKALLQEKLKSRED